MKTKICNLRPDKSGLSLTGFTLTEVFVTIAILVLLSSSILTTIVVANRIVNRIKYRVAAMNFARGALEELKNRGFDNLLETDGFIQYECTLPDGDFKNTLSGQRQYRIENQSWGAEVVDYKRITVQVTWNDPHSQEGKTQEYVVYLADKVSPI